MISKLDHILSFTEGFPTENVAFQWLTWPFRNMTWALSFDNDVRRVKEWSHQFSKSNTFAQFKLYSDIFNTYLKLSFSSYCDTSLQAVHRWVACTTKWIMSPVIAGDGPTYPWLGLKAFSTAWSTPNLPRPCPCVRVSCVNQLQITFGAAQRGVYEAYLLFRFLNCPSAI